jgi:hypothetical protein
MKKLYYVISIVVILALVCSPVLAVSKADLISQYKGQSSPTILTPIPTPTPAPTPYIPSYPYIPESYDEWSKFPAPPEPTPNVFGGTHTPSSYPYIPASYYEWSKFPAPPEPTPRVISDEEWKEITDRYSSAFA